VKEKIVLTNIMIVMISGWRDRKYYSSKLSSLV